MSVYRRPDPIPRRRPEQQVAASPLEPVRPQSDDLHHLVARKIFAAISAGHFAEGSILPNEHVLGETLGVSRTALREAIKGLSSKGMLETRRRRGTQVTDRSQWTMVDGEVINWSRKVDTMRISEELWEGLALVMPGVAAAAAANPARARIASLGTVGERTMGLAALFTEVARLSGNRFLFSMASISLVNLIQDDRAYLDRAFAAMGEAAIDALRKAIGMGDAPAAKSAMEALFAPTKTASAAERVMAG